MTAPAITNVTVLGNQVTITGTNLWQDMTNTLKRELNNLDGADTNINSVPFVSALFGNGADFESTSSQRIELGDVTTFQNSTSVCAWFKIESDTGAGQNIHIRGDTLTSDFAFFVRPGLDIQVNLHADNVDTSIRKIVRTNDNSLNTGIWYLGAFTWDSTTGSNTPKLYIDAVEQTSNLTIDDNDIFTTISSGTDSNIGGNLTSSAFFDGIITKVYQFNGVWNANDFKNLMPVVTVNSLDQDKTTWTQFSADKTTLVLDFGSTPPNMFPVTVENADGVSNTFMFTAGATINLPECSEVLWPIQPQNVTNRFVNRSDSMIWKGGNRTETANTSRTSKVSFRIDSRFAATFENELLGARQVAAVLNINGYDFFNDGFSNPLVYVLHIDPPIREQAFYRYDVIFKKVP